MAFPLLPVLMGAGALLGKMGGGAAKERQAANVATQNAHASDREALLRALQMNEAATMNRAQLGVQAPQARAKQALLGSLLANAQTARYQPPPGVRMGAVSGGIDLSSLLRGARQAGGALTSQATEALQSRSDIPAMADAAAAISPTPKPRNAGLLESLLSGGGSLASMAALVAQARQQSKGGGA